MVIDKEVYKKARDSKIKQAEKICNYGTAFWEELERIQNGEITYEETDLNKYALEGDTIEDFIIRWSDRLLMHEDELSNTLWCLVADQINEWIDTCCPSMRDYKYEIEY